MSKDDNADTGFILQVGLDYPSYLHDLHNSYPMAAEHLNITHEMLSPATKALAKKFNKKVSISNVKLVPNLYDKKLYTCHFRNLKFYVRNGLKVTKIHRIMSFTQRAWAEPYIKTNTERRKNATSEF